MWRCGAIEGENQAQKHGGRGPGLRPRGQKQLTDEQIQAGVHRRQVGGRWEEIGPLQLEFMQQRGLEARHKLLDVGCGAMRGGLHFVRYLDTGNYHGIDIEPSVIKAGRWELRQERLMRKKPNFVVSDRFEVGRFGTTFHYAVAVSLFTHLNMNEIARCLTEVGRVLEPDGEFYATFFEAPSPVYLESLSFGPWLTSFDRDPYHYSFQEMAWLAGNCGLEAELIGEWGHPLNQRMLCFSLCDIQQRA
jgi:cyclopropane fatty-acyl-phospholipid synthase-like methyltransferase